MKEINFTISRHRYGITIRTKSLLADQEDKEIESVACVLLNEMFRLTDKYNNRDIGVSFDVE